MSRKITMIAFTIVFCMVTIVLGFFSFTSLVGFYVNEETVNNDWKPDLGNKFETDEATAFAQKLQFINFNGAVRNLLGQREMNDVVKLDNGHLIEPQPAKTDEEIKAAADEVIKYADFCAKQGKPLLYVQTIPKVDKDNKLLPAGIEDYSNENADAFLDRLRAGGVDVLDIRECLKNDGMDMYEYTYATDHHWTTLGCFYTFTKIADWVGDKTGIIADPKVTDINNYEIMTYSRWHLGSYGQRTGIYFAGIDDYDLIIPAFDVKFTGSGKTSHSFREEAVNEEIFEMKDPSSRYTYDHALKNPEGVSTTAEELSLLFITDSYATGMIPYLKLAYSDYDEQFYNFGFSADYILQTEPDVVIMMPFTEYEFTPDAVFFKPGETEK